MQGFAPLLIHPLAGVFLNMVVSFSPGGTGAIVIYPLRGCGQGAGSREQGAGSREQGAGSRDGVGSLSFNKLPGSGASGGGQAYEIHAPGQCAYVKG